jgi:hypothetical protein
MTANEWMACTTPTAMLEYLRGKASDRKLRLFEVACCRLVWHLLPDRCHRLVEAVERYAERETRPRDLVALFKRYNPGRVATSPVPGSTQAVEAVDELGLRWRMDLTKNEEQWSPYRVARSVSESLAYSMLWQKTRQLEGHLLHDLFGPLPFRPVTLDPAWLTWHDGLLVSMARQMYDSRDFSDMPILADALEEGGCSNQDILGHCRSGGEHVRGCWVVDLLLGKS